jgi:hypothetical protein
MKKYKKNFLFGDENLLKMDKTSVITDYVDAKQQHLVPLLDKLRAYGQDISGIRPEISGGGQPTATYREARQRKDQALQQLAPPVPVEETVGSHEVRKIYDKAQAVGDIPGLPRWRRSIQEEKGHGPNQKGQPADHQKINPRRQEVRSPLGLRRDRRIPLVEASPRRTRVRA